MKISEYHSLQKRSKYGNVKTKIDGITFDSKKESVRYCELKLLRDRGYISNLELQVHFPIMVNNLKICTYIADFRYIDASDKKIVEDVKSEMTKKLPVYKLKKKLMFACYDIEIQEI